jgi:hypothetical protein
LIDVLLIVQPHVPLRAGKDMHYAAFYADCEHELRPVKSGYRVCLVYNLVHVGDGAPPAALNKADAVAEMKDVVRQWSEQLRAAKGDGDVPERLVYVTDHK